MHSCLCDFVLDIVQNSVEAGAKRIDLDFFETAERLSVRVRDDGKGMGPEEKKKALDPFYTDGTKHARRRVGLGIPFLLQTLQMTGGSWKLESEKGRGTDFSFDFDLANIDTPPLGETVPLFLAALSAPGGYELSIRRTRRGRGEDLDWSLLRSELSEAVGGLSGAGQLNLIRDFLASQEGSGEPGPAAGGDGKET